MVANRSTQDKKGVLYSVIYCVAAFTFYWEAAKKSNLSEKMVKLCVDAQTYYQGYNKYLRCL